MDLLEKIKNSKIIISILASRAGVVSTNATATKKVVASPTTKTNTNNGSVVHVTRAASPTPATTSLLPLISGIKTVLLKAIEVRNCA